MKITNKLNLPDSIVRAVSASSYKPGRGISVTTLLSPPHIRALREAHAEELVEDAADRIWSMVGQIGHAIAERAGGAQSLTEERLHADLDGQTITGQVDLYENGIVTDFKFTTVWSAQGKPEWEAQLNAYAWLLRRVGLPVERLQIVAVFRDWQKSKALSGDYPSAGVAAIPCRLWTDEEAEAFLRERLAAHRDPKPPICSPEERWEKAPVYAVTKEGRKSAVKLHADEASAQAHAQELGKGHSVQFRPGERIRCASYCNVSAWCPLGAQ